MISEPHILIVAAEKLLVDLLSEQLHSDTSKLSNAASIEEARIVFGNIHPTLVIFDAELTGSLEFLISIRSIDEPAEVVALAESADIRAKLSGLGVESIVDKGQGLKPLLDSVHACMRDGSRPLDIENKAKVLLVDDEADIRKTLSTLLTKWGYSVISAKNGDDALQMIESHPELDVVLLDLRMPGRGGLEILKEIHARTPKLGVIIMTALLDREIARRTIELGAFDYLIKPFDLSALETTISACLSRQEYRGLSWWKRLTR